MDLANALWLLLLMRLLLCGQSEKVPYNDYQVLRIPVSNEGQASILKTLETKFDFWADPMPGRAADIMVSTKTKGDLLDFLKENHLDWSVFVEDVQVLIDAEARAQTIAMEKNKDKSEQHNMDWESYHPLEDIYEWFDYLEGIQIL